MKTFIVTIINVNRRYLAIQPEQLYAILMLSYTEWFSL